MFDSKSSSLLEFISQIYVPNDRCLPAQLGMSSENVRKRRRIIQKLDFENCIVTNIKTRARGRKKLRARILREIAGASKESSQPREKSTSVSPVLTRKTHSEDAEPKSPVLIKNQCRNGCSNDFLKRKKFEFSEKGGENISESLTIEEISSSPGSPVFRTSKKHKLENISLHLNQGSKSVLERMNVTDVFSSHENSSSGLQNSFQIDDFTQESQQSVRISSVDSKEANKNNSNYSVEQNDVELNTFCQYSPAELSNSFNTLEKPVKKHYKKNSLLGRLHKLQQKQASEKLLWQHQNRKKSTGSLKVLIINFWREEFNYFIKCQSILSDFEKTFLIVDSRWVPSIKKIKENSVLLLHPPWQKLIVEEPMMKVLLNVICLDILDETKEPIVQKRTLESVPKNLFEIDKKLFIDSLFFSCGSGLLY